MNPNLTPGPPEGQEPIEQLFRDVFELADETAQRITDTEVDARLDQLLRKNGRGAPPGPEPDPAKVLDAARRQAGKIVADAQRAAAETAEQAACAAQSAGEAARRQVDLIMAEADGYSDMALSQAAEIVAGARSQAESIIADAREQARQILVGARVQAGQADGWERQHALAAAACTQISGPNVGGILAELVAMVEHRTTRGADPAGSDELLPSLPDAMNFRTSGSKFRLMPELRNLKIIPGASQDGESSGLLRRRWRLMRWLWQSGLSNGTVGLLVVARPGGAASVPDGHVPVADAHVAGLPTVILDLCVTSPGSGPSPGKGRWPGDIRGGELAGSGSAAAGVAFLLPPLQGFGADPGVPGQ